MRGTGHATSDAHPEIINPIKTIDPVIQRAIIWSILMYASANLQKTSPFGGVIREL